ncbi:MAG: DUF3108 domain-containing protein, partial [Gammaproteobacteria bacterium]|nr:DUF3108 domain-containing protein [Gammaproteobacteria bacterium]
MLIIVPADLVLPHTLGALWHHGKNSLSPSELAMRPHKTLRGHIHYTSSKPGREGVERGREHFTITVHGDGRRTPRAHCEIDDEPNVLRDVTLTKNKNWDTLDAFVRLSLGDEQQGSSWFYFGDTGADCEGWTHERGRFSEHEAYDERPAIFGTHPIQGDAWHLSVIDRSEGPKVHTFDRFLMTSLDHRGATGPSLVWHDPGMIIEFVGEETITVGAGTFDALHFCYGERGSTAQGSNETNEHPPYEVWVTADGEFVLLKAQVTGYMQTQYALVSLEVHE